MSSPRRDGRRTGRGGDGAGRTPAATRAATHDTGFGFTVDGPGPWLGAGGHPWALAGVDAPAPHPWALERVDAPAPHPWALPLVDAPVVFALQPPDYDPSPWTNMPWGPAGEAGGLFGNLGAGGAAPRKDDNGAPDVFSGGGDRSAAADGRASCLPLARQVGLRAAGGDGGADTRNFILSPLSLHAALALVAAGTRGETQRELLRFLGSASLDDLMHPAAPTAALVGRLRGLPQASFACGVWVDGNWALTPEFADAAASRFAAVAEAVDFVSAAEAARRRVNAFVGEATGGRIRDVLPPGSVDSNTVAVLANALYFRAAWVRPFEPRRTFAAPFHLPGGATVRAPFMTTGLFKEQLVAVFPGFKALKLPYKSDGGAHQAAFYMLILLPDGGEAVEISDLYDMAVSTPDFIRKHTPVGDVPVGRFMVPKFKFTFEFEASEDMAKLGVTEAFDCGDFSGMVAGGKRLFISGVFHKATIEVDELGTVATAATAVVVAQQCLRALPRPVDFVADRPFLFVIVEERTGAVLFIGHVVNPLAE